MSDGRIVTLGMFIIDTFRYLDDDGQDTGQTKEEQLGGGGTYFAIATRHFLPPTQIGQIIHRDPLTFPPKFQAELMTYGSDMFDCQERGDGIDVTIGCNIYRGEVRDFEWVTPALRLWPKDLLASKLWMVEGQSQPPSILHFLGAPQRSVEVLDGIDAIARGDDGDVRGWGWNPHVVFEPVPSTCIPENLPTFRSLTPRISILSPNHVESLSLLSFIPSSALTSSTTASAVDADDPSQRGSEKETQLKRLVEQAARMMMNWKPKIGVVIRSGALGACAARLIQGEVELTWIPAYHQPILSSNGPTMNPSIVDVTGGGNAFLGGLSAGLRLCDGDLVQAAVYGSVGASYAIEQDGLPRLTTEDGEDRWNGSSPMSRVKELAGRCGISL